MSSGFTAPHYRAILDSYVKALGELRATEAIEPLLKLAEGEVGVRSVALRALSKIGVDLSAETIAALSNDPSQSLAAALASTLATSDPPLSAPEQFRRFLSHPNSTLRTAALRLVRRTNDVAALEAGACHGLRRSQPVSAA